MKNNMDIYSFLDKSLYKLTPERSASSVVNPENIDSGLSTGFSEMVSGGIKQGKNNFDNTETGFILGIDDGLAKFYIGNTTNYLNWTGTELIISGNISATTGTIGGFTIGTDYIRDTANTFGFSSTVTAGDDVRFWAGDTFANRSTAPFRVDEEGNIVVKSLRRDDFHWFTIFESIDGYSKVFDTGTITTNGTYLALLTDTDVNDITGIYKYVSSSLVERNFSHDFSFKTNFRVASLSGIETLVGVGYSLFPTGLGGGEFIGFRHYGNTLYGAISQGDTNYETVELSVISANTDYELACQWDASTKTATFTLTDPSSNVDTGTITLSTFPLTSSANPLIIEIMTLNGAAKEMRIYYWDFWQSNI